MRRHIHVFSENAIWQVRPFVTTVELRSIEDLILIIDSVTFILPMLDNESTALSTERMATFRTTRSFRETSDSEIPDSTKALVTVASVT